MIDTILLAGALFAAQGGVPTAPAAAPAEDNRRICRVMGELGSRLARRRVCGTRAEWAERDRQDRQVLNDGRQRSLAPTYDDLVHNSPNRPTTRCARC